MTNPIEDIFNETVEDWSKRFKAQKEALAERERVDNANVDNISSPSQKWAYMAGKLFSEADQIQRQREHDLLKQAHADFNIEREIFSPIHSPVNDKSTLPSAIDIFNGDERALLVSDVIFADLTDGDLGVAMELGMVIYKDVSIYAYISDIRIETAGRYEGINVPYGYNQFVVGGIEKYFNKVYLSFDEALEAYIEGQTT